VRLGGVCKGEQVRHGPQVAGRDRFGNARELIGVRLDEDGLGVEGLRLA
jgi:hypothetical protein